MRWVASQGVCTPLHWAMYYYTAAVCEGEGLKLEVRFSPQRPTVDNVQGPAARPSDPTPLLAGQRRSQCVCVCVCMRRARNINGVRVTTVTGWGDWVLALLFSAGGGLYQVCIMYMIQFISGIDLALYIMYFDDSAYGKRGRLALPVPEYLLVFGPCQCHWTPALGFKMSRAEHCLLILHACVYSKMRIWISRGCDSGS